MQSPQGLTNAELIPRGRHPRLGPHHHYGQSSPPNRGGGLPRQQKQTQGTPRPDAQRRGQGQRTDHRSEMEERSFRSWLLLYSGITTNTSTQPDLVTEEATPACLRRIGREEWQYDSGRTRSGWAARDIRKTTRQASSKTTKTNDARNPDRPAFDRLKAPRLRHSDH